MFKTIRTYPPVRWFTYRVTSDGVYVHIQRRAPQRRKWQTIKKLSLQNFLQREPAYTEPELLERL